MAASFYVIKDLQSFYRKNDVLFLLCARQPEYDILLEKEKFAIQENYRHAWESLFVNIPNQNYDLKPFTENEIKEFVSKYKAYLPDNRKQRSIEENASEIFKDTRGHPIMVKFSVFQRGLRADVEDRYGRYLIIDNNAEKPRSDRISTVIICSLFHISTLQLTDELLDKMGLIAHANDLDRAILYSQNDKTWKTLHPRWDEELLTYIFSFRDKNLIQIMKNNLSFALQKILRYCDERTILIVANTLYATIIYVKVISTDILDEIFSNIPASFSDKFKINLYIIKGRGLQGLGRHIEAIAYYDQALRMDPNDVTALHNKGLSLGYLEKIEDANSTSIKYWK